MKNVVIVGFMGTGKTTIAKALASDIKKKYVSTDALIEEHENKAIGEIFHEKGETYFREVEREVIKEVSSRSDQVIDAGGGVVVDELNMENLRKNGIIICLWATVETIYERTYEDEHRPLLNVEDPMDQITELLQSRRLDYESADVHVETDDRDVWDIVEEIKRIMDEKRE